tara:strand:- start:2047 stop:2313 length:267 start_codon:yes stop_codon:yes gene_type:complete
MNYYIVTKEVYDTLDKDQISYMHKSQDRTQRLISTTETVSNNVRKFQSITTCSNYTFTNHSEWSGDGYGIEEFDLNEGGYISAVDDLV